MVFSENFAAFKRYLIKFATLHMNIRVYRKKQSRLLLDERFVGYFYKDLIEVDFSQH